MSWMMTKKPVLILVGDRAERLMINFSTFKSSLTNRYRYFKKHKKSISKLFVCYFLFDQSRSLIKCCVSKCLTR